MATGPAVNDAPITAIRWTARAIGVLTGGFLLFLFIAESWEKWSTMSRIAPVDMLGLCLLGVYIASMFLALRWERASVLIGLAALACFTVLVGIVHGIKPRGGLNAFILVFWLPLVLYLLCWWLEGQARQNTKAIL